MATKPIFDDVPAWPEQKAAQAIDRHHNKPPLEEVIPLEFKEALLAERGDFLTLLDRYLGTDEAEGAVDRAVANDEKTFALCGDVIKALRAIEQHVDKTHKAVKQPYLDGGRLVDAEKNRLTARIAAGRAKVQIIMDEYADRKRREEAAERARAEEDRRKLEQLARENNLDAALPPVEEPAKKAEPVRSDSGSTISTSVEHVAVIEDYAKAYRKVKDDAAVREAIEKAIQRLVKAAKGKIELPGVRIVERTKTITR